MFPCVLPTIMMFQISITVFDVTTSDTGGRATKVLGDDYTISGVIQPSTPETLIYLPEGEKQTGAKLIHSTTQLTTGSYVRYDDLVYRVNPVGKWGESTNGGFYRYICSEINIRSLINA